MAHRELPGGQSLPVCLHPIQNNQIISDLGEYFCDHSAGRYTGELEVETLGFVGEGIVLHT
jgi:hypothetical protein